MEQFILEVEFTTESFLVYRSKSVETGYFSNTIYDSFLNNKYEAFYELGFMDMPNELSPSLRFLWLISNTFIHTLTHDADLEISRTPKKFTQEIFLELSNQIPYCIGSNYIDYEYLNELWIKLTTCFLNATSDVLEINKYLLKKKNDLFIVGRVYFHLVENRNSEKYPFAFLGTYSILVEGSVKNVPLKNALIEYKENYPKLLDLLSTIIKASKESLLVENLYSSGDLFTPCKLTSEEAYVFLKELEIYEQCGIVCRIPNFWKRKYKSKVSVTINDIKSKVGMDSLLDFETHADYNGNQLTKEELIELLKESEGLNMFKGQWIEVNHQKINELLANIDEVSSNDALSLKNIISVELSSSKDKTVEIRNKDFLYSKINSLILNRHNIEIKDGFKGLLRRYQEEGCNWIMTMYELGLGCLLADDMGLGKTVQILCFLESLRVQKNVKTLLIVPASLLYNWKQEAFKFTPNIKVFIIQNSNINLDEIYNDFDLFIMSYGLSRRFDFTSYRFDILILDEAQAIKNSEVNQTKAIKKIKADYRICLTGTPIENRIMDLWSIFDFLNKGLLGSKTEFVNFNKELNDNNQNYSKLKSIITPFIKRRVKTDKTIISDLPDKNETKVYVGMSKKQIALYKQLVLEIEKSLDESSGIKRQGLLLSTIIKFKQICNHPDQFLGVGEYDPSLSAKFEALKDLTTVIKEKRERVLIFTQFKEIIPHLKSYLETIFDEEGLVIHGDVNSKKRSELVKLFNSEDYVPFMILSLKAGGVGLNLTKANHVIHFDRWWNPAVENQATDRAFRIGQTKNVFVYKFITAETIEEKIDKMITEKLSLAEEIITSSGESWITNMSNSELMKLFRLGD